MYLEYFNLNEEPFRLTPDPRFLHLAEPHRDALRTLLQTVVMRKGFAVCAGPVGTGKSTLVHAAIHILTDRTLAKSPIASAMIVNPLLSRNEFLEALLEEFEVSCPAGNKQRQLLALQQMLLEVQGRGSTTVLVIDEAHLLSMDLLEEIRLLSNLDSYREKLLQVILCGQSELLPLLARPEMAALRQRIAGQCVLRPLTLAEMRSYVIERLYVAGLKGSSPFPGLALELIHHFSQGVPRLINLICADALALAFESKRKPIEPDIIQEAAAALGLAGASLGKPTNGSRPRSSPEAQVAASAVDTLIDAMREGRTIARSEP